MVSFVNESLEPKTKLSAKQLVFFLLLFDHSVVSDSSVTPWTAAHQAPLSMGFPRHEYWSGLPFPSPGDLHNPGVKPKSPVLQADSLPQSHQGSIGEVCFCFYFWWFVSYYGRAAWKLFFLPYTCNGVLLISNKEWTTKPWKAWLTLTCISLSERIQSGVWPHLWHSRKSK